MSRYSGKCDLADHIMMEKMQPDATNPNILVSDELECFNIFKERTGGKIYQTKKMPLTMYNIFEEIERVNEPRILSYRKETKEVVDKRTSTGTKTVETYIFTYLGKDYREKDLSKINYYSYVEIPFDTIFDILPYYPYVIGSAASDETSEHIVISSKSEVDNIEEIGLNFGNRQSASFYRKALQDHYLELFEKYFKEEAKE